MIGGYFLGPSATGQASFYFTHHTPETAVATYFIELWKGQHPPSPPSKELQAVFDYWRPAAIVAVAGQQSPVVRALTRLFGKPAWHIGQVFWRLFSWQLRGLSGPSDWREGYGPRAGPATLIAPLAPLVTPLAPLIAPLAPLVTPRRPYS
jgi:hypothetical protein